jgi:hypothetical protein
MTSINDVLSWNYNGVITYGKVISIVPGSTMVIILECDSKGIVKPLTCREPWDSESENCKLVIPAKKEQETQLKEW